MLPRSSCGDPAPPNQPTNHTLPGTRVSGHFWYKSGGQSVTNMTPCRSHKPPPTPHVHTQLKLMVMVKVMAMDIFTAFVLIAPDLTPINKHIKLWLILFEQNNL